MRGHVHLVSSVKSKGAFRQHMGQEHKQPCLMLWTVSFPQHWQLKWWVWQKPDPFDLCRLCNCFLFSVQGSVKCRSHFLLSCSDYFVFLETPLRSSWIGSTLWHTDASGWPKGYHGPQYRYGIFVSPVAYWCRNDLKINPFHRFIFF